MAEQKNLRQLTDGTVLEVSPEELEAAREKAEAIIVAEDFDRVIMRTCWVCNPAHFHLAEADGILLRCFGCGCFYIDGVDITDYSDPE